jgi:hypothetical protein
LVQAFCGSAITLLRWIQGATRRAAKHFARQKVVIGGAKVCAGSVFFEYFPQTHRGPSAWTPTFRIMTPKQIQADFAVHAQPSGTVPQRCRGTAGSNEGHPRH